jgi:recombination protein RecR
MTTKATGGNGSNLEQRVRLTRIAYGMPLGGDLEYADHVTVGICIENRREIE